VPTVAIGFRNFSGKI